MHPPAILFDLDDTLISFDGVSALALADACAHYAAQRTPPYPTATLIAALRETQAWFWSDPARHKTGREDLRAARRRIVRKTLDTLGHPDPAADALLADTYTDLHNARTCLYPATIPTLTALRAQGTRLVLITNGAAQGQRAKLTRFGLTPFFEHILIDTELGFGKPDPRVFTHALALLGLPASAVWMVGDNPVWDIQPPQSLGIHAIWHDAKGQGLAPGSSIIPDRIITDIGELMPA